MKTYLILAALTVAAPQPALAYHSGRANHSSASTLEQIDLLARQINLAVKKGRLSQAQGQRLRAQAAQLRMLRDRYQRGGLTSRERSILVQRADALRMHLNAAERGRPAIAARSKYIERPSFVRTPSHHIDDTALDLRRFQDRSSDEARFKSDLNSGLHGNDLRGPAPPMHDEGD
jgi:hypothetical protein